MILSISWSLYLSMRTHKGNLYIFPAMFTIQLPNLEYSVLFTLTYASLYFYSACWLTISAKSLPVTALIYSSTTLLIFWLFLNPARTSATFFSISDFLLFELNSFYLSSASLRFFSSFLTICTKLYWIMNSCINDSSTSANLFPVFDIDFPTWKTVELKN